jgi:hypothetical protein
MSSKPPVPTLTEAELAQIAQAAAYLEHPGYLMRAANLLGKPAESLIGRLPDRARNAVAKAVQKAMTKALAAAVQTLDAGSTGNLKHDATLHMAATAATGFAGGFFGLAGLPVELPVTTVLMLRSIAQIARDSGADLHDPAVRLECLAVLALGSRMPTPVDVANPAELGEAMESAYYTSRLGLTLAMRSAATFVAGRSAVEVTEALSRGAAPALVRLLGLIASRFQVVVSEKALAQTVPMLGAAAGAALNGAFTDHFNTVARMHFGLRALERRHGEAAVRQAYARQLERQKNPGLT